MKYFLLLFAFLGTMQLEAQVIGGQETYRFLGLSPSARISGLAGNLITVADDDVNLAYQNPASLNSQMHQQIGFNHSFHLSDIGHSFVTYGHYADKWELSLFGGLQYVNYGEIERTNEFFQTEGTFRASEYAFVVGAAKQVYDRLSLGANLKVISSQFDIYQSMGVAADLAVFYRDTSKNFTATMVMKNIGTQITTYDDERERLPFEIQIGVSKRLRYLPFRFSIIYEHLDSWNILYDDPNLEQGILFIGQEDTGDSASADFFDNLFRHFVFNGELLLGAKDNFRLRFGYRHVLRRELSVNNFGSLSGFTFGVGLKINRFRIDYGRYNLHLAGGQNHFSVSTNIKEFKK
ncbi:MAG: type IX secretion system protein PorQ [Saprospiraceae bacterium]